MKSKKKFTEKAEARKQKTYLALVLDESSSMAPLASDTIAGFNTVIDGIKSMSDEAGDTYVTLITFATTPKVRLMHASAETLEPLTEASYRPNGWTAMLDGIGMAIDAFEGFDSEDADVAFKITVITDGEENRSRTWSGQQIASKIEQLEARGNWVFEIVGANLSVEQLRKMTGIQQTFTYAPTRQGTQSLYSALDFSNQSYVANRSMGNLRYSGLADGAAAAGSLDMSSNAMTDEMRRIAEEARKQAADARQKAGLDALEAAQKKARKKSVTV